MALDDKIYELRREKLKQIEALGQPPYPNKYRAHHTIERVRDEYESWTAEQLTAAPPRVHLAGRIMTLRLMGKAGFAHLQSAARADRRGTGKLQVYVRHDGVGEKAFQLFKLLDIGDIIGVHGYLFRTKTGELTIHVEDLTLLAKALLPLPEKWHGLTDVELRYRQRYLDLIVNPEVREVFLARSRLVKSFRNFLDQHHFLEVETPMMQPVAGGAVARPFVTHHNTLDMDLYLRIAPELYLKRLMVGGFDRVYEINRNFRNEGLGWRWNPEFTMLEFYQAYADFRDIMELTQDLLIQAAIDVTGGTKVKFGDHEIDWAPGNWTIMTMRQAIMQYWPRAAAPTPQMPDFSSPDRVGHLVQRFNQARSHIAYDPSEPAGKTIAALFEAVVEEQLIQPTIIYEFPAAVSPLSKNKPDEPDWTERFEIFAAQMEISNGFSELNDPQEQRRRFEQQLRQRERGDEEAHQMDEDYIRALSFGLPPTGGCGVGVDRVAMLLTNSQTIRDVILFPLLRPERISSADPADSA
ncbi:MAG: lysine--tRNA ligase [Acidobacteria bacterium]|nr:lysine--tRNA ligase [Acidobacteriota bacterium]